MAQYKKHEQNMDKQLLLQNTGIPPAYKISIVMSGIMEYVILLAVIRFLSKKADF